MDYLPELEKHVLTLRRYGGPLTLQEKMKRGGGGSGKLVYVSGVPGFDQYRQSSAQEEIFVTLEQLQAGVVVWMQKHLRVAGVVFSLDELDRFELALQYPDSGAPAIPLEEAVQKRRFPAHLYIYLKDGTTFHFRVLKAHFRRVHTFLHTDPLGHYLVLTRSTDLEEDGEAQQRQSLVGVAILALCLVLLGFYLFAIRG